MSNTIKKVADKIQSTFGDSDHHNASSNQQASTAQRGTTESGNWNADSMNYNLPSGKKGRQTGTNQNEFDYDISDYSKDHRSSATGSGRLKDKNENWENQQREKFDNPNITSSGMGNPNYSGGRGNYRGSSGDYDMDFNQNDDEFQTGTTGSRGFSNQSGQVNRGIAGDMDLPEQASKFANQARSAKQTYDEGNW